MHLVRLYPRISALQSVRICACRANFRAFALSCFRDSICFPRSCEMKGFVNVSRIIVSPRSCGTLTGFVSRAGHLTQGSPLRGQPWAGEFKSFRLAPDPSLLGPRSRFLWFRPKAGPSYPRLKIFFVRTCTLVTLWLPLSSPRMETEKLKDRKMLNWPIFLSVESFCLPVEAREIRQIPLRRADDILKKSATILRLL